MQYNTSTSVYVCSHTSDVPNMDLPQCMGDKAKVKVEVSPLRTGQF